MKKIAPWSTQVFTDLLHWPFTCWEEWLPPSVMVWLPVRRWSALITKPGSDFRNTLDTQQPFMLLLFSNELYGCYFQGRSSVHTDNYCSPETRHRPLELSRWWPVSGLWMSPAGSDLFNPWKWSWCYVNKPCAEWRRPAERGSEALFVRDPS